MLDYLIKRHDMTDEEFVLSFVEEQKKIAKDWDPATSIIGDGGDKSFGDYWNETPRNYKRLAEIILHHMRRAL